MRQDGRDAGAGLRTRTGRTELHPFFALRNSSRSFATVGCASLGAPHAANCSKFNKSFSPVFFLSANKSSNFARFGGYPPVSRSHRSLWATVFPLVGASSKIFEEYIAPDLIDDGGRMNAIYRRLCG